MLGAITYRELDSATSVNPGAAKAAALWRVMERERKASYVCPG